MTANVIGSHSNVRFQSRMRPFVGLIEALHRQRHHWIYSSKPCGIGVELLRWNLAPMRFPLRCAPCHTAEAWQPYDEAAPPLDPRKIRTTASLLPQAGKAPGSAHRAPTATLTRVFCFIWPKASMPCLPGTCTNRASNLLVC